MIPRVTHWAHTRFGSHFLREKTVLRPTWKFLLGLLVALALFLGLTGGYWMRVAARSLVHVGPVEKADALVVDPLETHYILFERAGRMMRHGLARRVITPVVAPREDLLNPGGSVPIGIVQLMCRAARIENPEIIAIREREPITLTAALQIRDYLVAEGIGSVTIVTHCFRSQRTWLAYRKVMAEKGITVYCAPVCGPDMVETWHRSLHGLQEVSEEWVKYWYYRLVVL